MGGEPANRLELLKAKRRVISCHRRITSSYGESIDK
jgi:hypothetical protein